MVVGTRVWSVGSLALLAVFAAAVVLLWPALRTDLALSDSSAAWAWADVGVTLSFTSAGAVAVGPRPQRILVACVAPAWLLGSLTHWALTLHQAVLMLALVSFPSGTLRGRTHLVMAALAVPVALQLFSASGTAATFVGVAVALTVVDHPRRSAWWPVVSAGLAAASLIASWLVAGEGSGPSPLLYATGLIAIAVTFPLATRQLVRDRARIDVHLISRAGTGSGLLALEPLLRTALGDPGLALRRSADAHQDTPPGDGTDRRRVLVQVEDGVVVVEGVTAALVDEATRQAVARVVRLMVTNERLRAADDERIAQLVAARSRLQAAVDDERTEIAARLRTDAIEPLTDLLAELAAHPDGIEQGADSQENVAQVRASTSAAISVMRHVVDGLAPVDLGGGRLGDALRSMADRTDGRVEVSLHGNVAGSERCEAAAYYVCAESVSNALKHSGATRIVVDVGREADVLLVQVTDDGRGGARLDGAGLQGIGDRVAAAGGRLSIVSEDGRGTLVRAEVPVSSPRARSASGRDGD